MELNLAELSQICHRVAKSKGFWDRVDEAKTDKLSLIISELGEALEAHRTNKFADLQSFEANKDLDLDQDSGVDMTPHKWFERYMKDTFEDEIADTFIRLMDFIVGYGVDNIMKGHCLMNNPEYPLMDMTISDITNLHKNEVFKEDKVFEIKIDKNVSIPTKIFWVCRYTTDIGVKPSKEDIITATTWVIDSLCELALISNMDLYTHIKYKLEYNTSRPHKHGKKY